MKATTEELELQVETLQKEVDRLSGALTALSAEHAKTVQSNVRETARALLAAEVAKNGRIVGDENVKKAIENSIAIGKSLEAFIVQR